MLKKVGGFFRRFFIWIICLLLSFFLFTFVFITAVHIDVDKIDKDMQDELIKKTYDICLDFNAKTQSDAEIFQRAVVLFAGEMTNVGFQNDIETKVKHEYIGGIG